MDAAIGLKCIAKIKFEEPEVKIKIVSLIGPDSINLNEYDQDMFCRQLGRKGFIINCSFENIDEYSELSIFYDLKKKAFKKFNPGVLKKDNTIRRLPESIS